MNIGQMKRPSREILAAFQGLPTSTISTVLEDMGIDGVIQNIKPIVAGTRFVGPAVTVKEMTGVRGTYTREDFPLAAVLGAAESGDVIAIDNSGHQVSTWGGMVSLAAKRKGVAGLLVDGGVRDWNEISEVGFSVFSRHVVCTSARTRIKIESINETIKIDGIKVRAGDVLVGDGTGVVVVPLERAEEVLSIARKYDEQDQRARAIIEGGGDFADALQGMLRKAENGRS